MIAALGRLDSMDNSLSTWLQLREPADAAARSDSLTRTIADALADQ